MSKIPTQQDVIDDLEMQITRARRDFERALADGLDSPGAGNLTAHGFLADLRLTIRTERARFQLWSKKRQLADYKQRSGLA